MFVFCCLNGYCSRSDCITVDGSEIWNLDVNDDDEICVRTDLTITDRTNRDLEILARIVRIEGSLVVTNSRNIVELPSMAMLRHVGGSISVTANQSLARILGFPSLESLDGELFVGENPTLTSFVGGSSLSSAGHIFFALNPELRTVTGFDALEFIEGDLILTDNGKLESLVLPRLGAVGRNLSLLDNINLSEIDFPQIETVSGFLVIRGLEELTTLKGFATLAEVGTHTEVSDCSSLTDIALPDNKLQNIVISGNKRLQKITGGHKSHLPPDGTIEITDNPALREVEVFADVTGLRSLQITNNLEIRSVNDWFPHLLSVEDLWVFGNSGLDPSEVERLLERVKVIDIPRVGDNNGEESSYEPCPWPSDGICDAQGGTALCLEDADDCEGF